MSVKIKRYTRIYRRRSPWQDPKLWICILLLIGLAVFVGISMADPIRDFLAGDFVQRTPESSSAESSLTPLPEVEPAPTPQGTPAAFDSLVMVEVSRESLTLENIESLIAEVRSAGANAVVVELKAADGTLYFRSQNELARAADAVSLSPVDLRTMTGLLREEGIETVALLEAFRDDTAHQGSTDSYIRYDPNPDMLWLDESADNGGMPWLDPYSEAAQQYVIDLAGELAEMGVGHILLASAQFPDVAGLEFALFQNPEGWTKQEALIHFFEGMRAELAPYGAGVILQVDGADALYGNDDAYGGSPFALGADAYAVNLIPSTVGEDLQIGEVIYTNPAYDVFNFYTAALTAIENANPGVTLMPMVDPSETDQLESVLNILSRFGISSYLLSTPTDAEVEAATEDTIRPEDVVSGQQEEEARREEEEGEAAETEESEAAEEPDEDAERTEPEEESTSDSTETVEPVPILPEPTVPTGPTADEPWDW